MSLRINSHLFKGLSETEFERALVQTTAAVGRDTIWHPSVAYRTELRFASRGDVHTVATENYPFCLALSEATGLPCIEIRLQEEALWDYTLFRGKEILDNFSTWPECWENPEDFTPEQWAKYVGDCRGNPRLLAEVWGLPLERIERYVRQWGWVETPDDPNLDGHHLLQGKAYPEDHFEYGCSRQFFDFYRAMGGLGYEESDAFRSIHPSG